MGTITFIGIILEVEEGMHRRTRMLLAILGLLLLVFALAALLYAWLPNPVESSVFPIPPALLVPPGASP
jgi:hypothetical protein